MHDADVHWGEVHFSELFLTSKRHGGDHGVGLHRRFDDGGGSCEPCSRVVFFFFLLLYVMDDGRWRDTQE
jgi:hypothetical protein